MQETQLKMKKLYLMMFIMIFLIGSVSAADWDNKLRYSNNDLKVTLDNSFLGIFPTTEIGTIELESHSSVDEVINIGIGRYKTAMYYGFNFWEEYPNGLGKVYFTDMKTGKEIDVPYHFAYLGEKVIDDFERTCSKVRDMNGSYYDNCIATKIGSHTEQAWIKLDTNDIPKGKIKIALIINYMPKNKLYDAVWTIAGKKVKKHAVFSSWLKNGMIGCWTLDETSGSTTVDFSVGQKNNGTIVGADLGAASGTASLGNAMHFIYPDNITVPNSQYVNLTSDFSVGIIWNTTTTNSYVVGKGGITAPRSYWMVTGALGNGKMRASIATSVGNNDLDSAINGLSGTDVLTIMTFNDAGDEGKLYTYMTNGTSEIVTDASATGTLNYNDFSFNIGYITGGDPTGDAYISEVWLMNFTINSTDVTDIYNSGDIISCASAELSIVLDFPASEQNFTTNNLYFTGDVLDPESTGINNVSLLINGTINQTNSSGFVGTYNFSSVIPDGYWNWTFQAYDDTGGIVESTRNFNIDTILPIINLTSPSGEITFHSAGDALDLNWTVTDTNLHSCWFNYNNTNTTLTCNDNTTTFNTEYEKQNLTFYANDTSGNLNNSITSWTFNLFDFNNYSYSENITESSSSTFTGIFQTSSSISSTYLEYNNTNYSASIVDLGGNIYYLSRTVTSPSVTSDTNITWLFWVNDINATSRNQTVFNVNIDDCSSYSFSIVNYTLVDEIEQTLINNSNSSIESEIILKSITGEPVEQFNQIFNGTSNATICSEINITNSNLKLYEQSRYVSDNYVYETNNIQNASISGGQIDIVLNDLLSSSATTFRIVFKSSTFLPVPNAIIDIQRKYIGEGIYRTIEAPITDENSEVSASLDLNAVVYKILVRINGTTIGTFTNPAIACDNILTGDCVVNLNERQLVDEINTYVVENNFAYSLLQNNRTISLIFEIPNGETRTVNLFVNQSTILGNRTSCNQTTLATSGQIDCEISDTLGDVFFTAKVNVDGDRITSPSGTILEDRSTYFGTDNIVLTFFLVLSLILLMVSDPIAVLLGIIIGLISSSLMLLLNSGNLFGTASVLMYVIIIAILLIIKISNRNR